MNSDVMPLMLGIAIGLIVASLLFQIWRARYTRLIRRDAVSRSFAVTTGKVLEQLVPYLPEFPFNPRDARFLGAPVDLVVFDGLSEGDLHRIVFVEIKTGNAGLSGRERRVRHAIEAGRVEWTELRVPPAGSAWR